jgi:hypothetical protein
MRAIGFSPLAKCETSRFSRKELTHMPGSQTTPGRPVARANAPVRSAFRLTHNVGTRDKSSFAAQWLAYTLPCRRFTPALTGDDARLGANAGRDSFTVTDFHRSFLADNPAHEQ